MPSTYLTDTWPVQPQHQGQPDLPALPTPQALEAAAVPHSDVQAVLADLIAAATRRATVSAAAGPAAQAATPKARSAFD